MRTLSDLLEAIAKEHLPVTESETKCAITRGEHKKIRRNFKMKVLEVFQTAAQSEMNKLKNEK